MWEAKFYDEIVLQGETVLSWKMATPLKKEA